MVVCDLTTDDRRLEARPGSLTRPGLSLLRLKTGSTADVADLATLPVAARGTDDHPRDEQQLALGDGVEWVVGDLELRGVPRERVARETARRSVGPSSSRASTACTSSLRPNPSCGGSTGRVPAGSTAQFTVFTSRLRPCPAARLQRSAARSRTGPTTRPLSGHTRSPAVARRRSRVAVPEEGPHVMAAALGHFAGAAAPARATPCSGSPPSPRR